VLKKDCPHYPCHDILEDCTYCYCPFYPCYDVSRGEWYESDKTRVWDCSKCNWIHLAQTVNNIYLHNYKNDTNSECFYL